MKCYLNDFLSALSCKHNNIYDLDYGMCRRKELLKLCGMEMMYIDCEITMKRAFLIDGIPVKYTCDELFNSTFLPIIEDDVIVNTSVYYCSNVVTLVFTCFVYILNFCM